MPRKPDIVGLRLRMPAGLHRLLATNAKRNNRSLNTEILWCIARQLGGEAPSLVENMRVEQRRMMEGVLRSLISDPQAADEAIARFNKERKE